MSQILASSTLLRECLFGRSGSNPGPASIIELSDQAKAVLERNKAAEAAVQRLASALQGDKPGDQRTTTKDLFEVMQSLANQQIGVSDPVTEDAAKKSTVQWQNYAPYGDPTLLGEEFLEKMRDHLMSSADFYDERPGLFPPDAGRNLQQAVRNGTVKVQRAFDVPDPNFHSFTGFKPSAIGGGIRLLRRNQAEAHRRDQGGHRSRSSLCRMGLGLRRYLRLLVSSGLLETDSMLSVSRPWMWPMMPPVLEIGFAKVLGSSPRNSKRSEVNSEE